MSGVLHPMGPEPARTYWLRRGILLAVVVVLAIMVVAAVAGLTKAAVATAPPPVIAAPETSSSPSPTAAASSTPPTASPTASVPSPSSAASQSTRATAGATPQAKAAPNAGATASAKPTPTTTVVGTPDCRPNDLRVTVKGDRTLSPGENNKLTLSVINRGQQTCLASVTDKNFELKIYSGTDRIWSSRDCAKSLNAFDKKLAAAAAVGWTMTWNGERSVKGSSCKTGSPTPKSGTYWATAQLNGAKPVQLRMIIS